MYSEGLIGANLVMHCRRLRGPSATAGVSQVSSSSAAVLAVRTLVTSMSRVKSGWPKVCRKPRRTASSMTLAPWTACFSDGNRWPAEIRPSENAKLRCQGCNDPVLFAHFDMPYQTSLGMILIIFASSEAVAATGIVCSVSCPWFVEVSDKLIGRLSTVVQHSARLHHSVIFRFPGG